jgi:hypothetical protein
MIPYVKEEGNAGRTSRRRPLHSGQDHWESGWKNRCYRERCKSEESPKEGYKARKEAENGVTKKGEESGEAQDLAGLFITEGSLNKSSMTTLQAEGHAVSRNGEAIAGLDQGEVTSPTRYQRLRYLSFGRPLGPNTYPIDVNTCCCGKAIALQRADRCIADAL